MYQFLQNTGCSYYLSSAINPFLYSLLSKRFRNGFSDLKNQFFKRLQNLFHRSTLSRTDSSRRANITNGINKSSFFDGFSMTPMTVETNCSKHDSTILVDTNCNLENSNLFLCNLLLLPKLLQRLPNQQIWRRKCFF